MAKPKAPAWLREAYRDGVDSQMDLARVEWRRMVQGQSVNCWLAQHDPRRRRCSALLERFHFVKRQTVEDALGGMLRDAIVDEWCPTCGGCGDVPGDFASDTSGGLMLCPACGGAETFRAPLLKVEVDALTLLAAWDPRLGGIACEDHHRRFDNHLTPELIVPRAALPGHVEEWGEDYDPGHLLDDAFGPA